MSTDKQEPITVMATQRRQFTGLLCGGGLLALTGCGGGDSEVPPVAPQITLQPQSVSVTVGQSVTLQVQASGSNLVYQWLRGAVAIAGATASTLVLVTQASDSEARFSVRVSNEGGSVTSADAVLTLTVPLVAPQITLQPQSVSVTVGQSVTLQVQASGSNLVYQWLRGAVAIAGATASTLVLVTQASDSEARFSVRVSNEVGTVTSAEVVLTLSVPPVTPVAPQIAASPQSVTAALGQSVSLQVVASGSNLAYQWLRNGANIAGANTSTLVFTVQATDEQARFSVQVSNTAGTVVSADAVLTLSLQTQAGISLLAGQIDGTGASQDGLGELARLGTIAATCVDRNGNLYLIDTGNTTLRKVSPFGVVTTLLQNFPADSAVAVDADGNFYGVRDRAIIKVGPDGSQQVLAGMPGVLGYADGPGAQATFARPTALAFDPQGNLLVADAADFTSKVTSINSFFDTFVYGGTVRKITPAGVVSTIAGKAGQTLSSQNLLDYIYAPSLPSSVNASQDLLLPNAIACDGQGNIYVADYLTNDIKKIDSAGSITVLATGPTTGIGFFWEKCSGVAVLGNGEVIFGQSDGESYPIVAGGFYPCDGITYPILRNVSHPTIVVLKRIDLTGAVHDFAGGQSFGVKTGPLPGSLGAVGPGGLVAAADNAVIRCTRTAVLRIRVS